MAFTNYSTGIKWNHISKYPCQFYKINLFINKMNATKKLSFYCDISPLLGVLLMKEVIRMKTKPNLNEIEIRKVISDYGDTVYKIAFSYCKSRADAEDIYQEVFIKYFKHTEIFESNIHEKAWLIRVTINCSKSLLRSYWYKRIIPLEENLDISVYTDEQSDVLNAVLELPVKYREVIHLYYYEGYSTKEIASILSRKETTVRTQLQRGREMLKIKLKEDLSYE